MLPSIEEAAKLAVGNWKAFEAFIWADAPIDADWWTIYHTSNRDSDLSARSNEVAILAGLQSYLDAGDDVRLEHFKSWLCGYVDGISIRVFDAEDQITAAFKTFYEIMVELEQYPILDETDYGRRVHEATIENIRDQGQQFVCDGTVPVDWPIQVFNWLWDNDDGAVESVDDRGGYPTEDQVKKALIALDIPCVQMV